MDKNKTNTSFNKWVSSINFNSLSKEAIQDMAGFTRYLKKFQFETALKLFLHGINAEKESLGHLDTSMVSPNLQRKLGLHSIQLYRAVTLLNETIPCGIMGDLSSAGSSSRGVGGSHEPTQNIYC